MPYQTKTSPTDRVFGALANPTRREILDLLLGGPSAVGDIATHFDMTRPSVSEHLRVLLDVGLVTEERRGRNRIYTVQAEPLLNLVGWLTPYERFWRSSLSGLREVLAEDAAAEPQGEVSK
jgi:DNA-binding transcriptional ArsR family regulator